MAKRKAAPTRRTITDAEAVEAISRIIQGRKREGEGVVTVPKLPELLAKQLGFRDSTTGLRLIRDIRQKHQGLITPVGAGRWTKYEIRRPVLDAAIEMEKEKAEAEVKAPSRSAAATTVDTKPPTVPANEPAAEPKGGSGVKQVDTGAAEPEVKIDLARLELVVAEKIYGYHDPAADEVDLALAGKLIAQYVGIRDERWIIRLVGLYLAAGNETMARIIAKTRPDLFRTG